MSAFSGEGRIEIPFIPITLTNPGHYYLARDLGPTGIVNGTAIRVEADNVTINLNGCTLRGISGALGGSGIYQGSAYRNLTVRNGSIHNCRGGISFRGGVYAEGQNAAVHGVRAFDNDYGIIVRGGGLVADCIAVSNAETGIVGDDGSTIRNCAADGNRKNGFSTGYGCVLDGCSARENEACGISAGRATTVKGCSAGENGDDGIRAAEGCVILECASTGNYSNGIQVARGCTITRCAVSASGKDGIRSSSAATIAGCTVENSGSAGIRVGGETLVKGCSAVHNEYGIRVTGDHAVVAGNLCNDTLHEGILVQSSAAGCRIEENNVVGASQAGIYVAGPSNVVVKNTASGNSPDYQITGAGNVVGCITNSAQTTYPWANFTY